MALGGHFDLLLSVPLACEYESVLLRPEQLAASRLSPSEIEDLLLSLLGAALEIRLKKYLGPRSADAGDNHVLSLAAQGHADAIITFNTRHFANPASELGVELHIPGEFLRLWRGKHGRDNAD
jgi:predicted nucleic acid-binding protein